MDRRDFLQTSIGTLLAGSLGWMPATAQDTLPSAPLLEEPAPAPASALTLWYRRPSRDWLDAQPIGNGRLGAMVYGGLGKEIIQLNEGTLWAGGPHDYANPDGPAALPEIRRLVFAGEWHEAETLVNAHFMG